MVDEAHERLSIQLERALLNRLAYDFIGLSQALFEGKLNLPRFRLVDTTTQLGAWHPSPRTLEFSRKLFLEHGWGTVIEVLKHEMAHQYTSEVLDHHGAPHDVIFRRVCAQRGIDPVAEGPPGAGDPDAGPPVLQKVAKLLALAASSNEHEAQLAMATAQRLMLKYNLEAVVDPSIKQYCFRHLGTPTGRVLESARMLAAIVADFFFVQAIWVPVWRVREGKRGTVLEVCGTRANVEMADYVHAFMTQTAERLWREHKRARRIKVDRDRQSYLAGVMSGFHGKLKSERALEERGESALVWDGDPALGRYYKKRHPYTRSSSHRSTANRPAHAQGRAAGEKIVLHRGLSTTGSGGPKLLGGG